MEFKDIQHTWEQQETQSAVIPDFEPAKQQLKKMRKNQRITQFILIATAMILVAFFFYITAYNRNGTLIGMSLMIGVLITRVFIEVKSRQKLQKLSVLLSLNDYKEQLIAYYNARKKLAFIGIPILLLIYNIGFAIMAYYFYFFLSRGFFYYIMISYIISFGILFYVIRKQVIKELHILRSLEEA